jgi:hypothetical protein
MIEPIIKNQKKRKIDWWVYSIPVLIILTLLSYFFVQSRPGRWGVITYNLAPFLIGFLSILFLIIGIIHSIIKLPFFTRWRIAGFICLIILCFTKSIYNKYPSSYDNYISKVKFRLPLDTAISIFWGGGTANLNYHVLNADQCWAYDMSIIKKGNSFSGDSTKLEDYFIYGLSVLSPASGKIVEVIDSFPNMPIGVLGGGSLSNPGGNLIIIEVAPKEFLVICHLQPKSVKVQVGDSIKQGQELALVGNSGNTSEPHIHIHLQNRNTIDAFAIEGIPLYFHNYLTEDGKLVEKGIPTGGFDEDGNYIGQTIQNVK